MNDAALVGVQRRQRDRYGRRHRDDEAESTEPCLAALVGLQQLDPADQLHREEVLPIVVRPA